MATANKRTIEHVEVDLTLTGEEAQVLYSILTMVGGSPKGARGKADNILTALNGEGYRFLTVAEYPRGRADWLRTTHDSGIVFADEDGALPSERRLR